MARYGDVNYAWFTKWGCGLGVFLFGFGVVGMIFGPALVGSLPSWEKTLFVGSGATGILTVFFSVFVFGIALPLTE